MLMTIPHQAAVVEPRPQFAALRLGLTDLINTVREAPLKQAEPADIEVRPVDVRPPAEQQRRIRRPLSAID